MEVIYNVEAEYFYNHGDSNTCESTGSIYKRVFRNPLCDFPLPHHHHFPFCPLGATFLTKYYKMCKCSKNQTSSNLQTRFGHKSELKSDLQILLRQHYIC